MENFEKWWEHTLMSNNKTFKLVGQETWKAALDWVLNYLDHSQEHKQIEDIIYEELEN